MEPLSALNLIERLEEQMFLMYDRWARSFSSDPEAARLFTTLKKEELSHRELVQKQRAIVLESGGFAGQDINIDLRVMDQTIDLILESTKNPPADLRGALEIAYSIESSAAEQYAFTALKRLSSDLGKLLDEYTDRFSEHFKGILDTIRRNRLRPVSPEYGTLVQLRVPYPATVTIDGSLTASGCNISDGGLYLTTGEAFTLGQEAALQLPLPEETLKVRAIVKHVQAGKGVGFQFTGLTDAQSGSISRFIDRVVKGEKADIPGAATAPACDVPAEPVTTASAAPQAAPESAKQPPRERAIIVNNSVFSSSDLQMVVSTLRDEGLDVLEISSPTAALEALADDITDRIVILAAETINDDSFPLLGSIKRNPAYSNLPLLVLSTSYDRKFINRVLSYGASFSHKMSLSPEALVSFLG